MENQITKEYLETIKDLNDLLPSAVFGGSFSLALSGLLNEHRMIKDIDIIICKSDASKNELFEILKLKESKRSEYNYTDDSEFNGCLVRLSKEFKGHDLCIFLYEDDENIRSSGFELETATELFNINKQNCADVINAKKDYVAKFAKNHKDMDEEDYPRSIKKHIMDIEFYEHKKQLNNYKRQLEKELI